MIAKLRIEMVNRKLRKGHGKVMGKSVVKSGNPVVCKGYNRGMRLSS